MLNQSALLTRYFAWGFIWIGSFLLMSCFIQDLVHLCIVQLFLVLNQIQTSVTFLSGLAWCFTNFWKVNEAWQGEGTLAMVLMTLFGISTGFLRRSWPTRWLPVALGILTLPAIFLYLNNVTYFADKGFWQILFSKLLTMALLSFTGIAIDKFLVEKVRPAIITTPKLTNGKKDRRKVIDV